MKALTLLNNFERELARPFFRDHDWLERFTEAHTGAGFSSAMNYDEKKSAWNLTAELPGVTKENVKIETRDGYLHLVGEKTKGLNTGKFDSRYRLPEGIDTEKIEAAFEDGVLHIEIPLTEKKSTKSIQIK